MYDIALPRVALPGTPMPKKSLSCVEKMYVAIPAVKPVTTGRGTNLTALRWDGHREGISGGGSGFNVSYAARGPQDQCLYPNSFPH